MRCENRGTVWHRSAPRQCLRKPFHRYAEDVNGVGTSFLPRTTGWPQIFCGPECTIRFHSDKQSRKRRKIRESLPKGICKRCSKPFPPRGGGRPQVFCSKACRVKWLNDIWNPRQPRKTTRRRGKEARKQDFSEEQKQIVLGTVLGDGSLLRHPSGVVTPSLTQGAKQLDGMRWKRDQLAFVFHRTEPNLHTKKTGERLYAILSVWHPYFFELRQIFYPRGHKILPKKVIDCISPLGLAVWYMDDGSWNSNPKSRQASIITGSFPVEDVEYASRTLEGRYALKSSVYTVSNPCTFGNGKKTYSRLVFLRSTIGRFFDIIRPFMNPSMKYKIE